VSSSLNFQACEHASKQSVRTLLHNLSLRTLVQSLQITDGSIIHFVYHFPSCSCSMSIILPFFCSFQPSPGVGNNRDSDATLNLLRRRHGRPQTGCKARSLARSRLDFPPPQHEAQTRNHLGYFPYPSARADQGGGAVCMYLLLTLIACRLPSQGEKKCPMSDYFRCSFAVLKLVNRWAVSLLLSRRSMLPSDSYGSYGRIHRRTDGGKTTALPPSTLNHVHDGFASKGD
jgi:hypothetical protein